MKCDVCEKELIEYYSISGGTGGLCPDCWVWYEKIEWGRSFTKKNRLNRLFTVLREWDTPQEDEAWKDL